MEANYVSLHVFQENHVVHDVPVLSILASDFLSFDIHLVTLKMTVLALKVNCPCPCLGGITHLTVLLAVKIR